MTPSEGNQISKETIQSKVEFLINVGLPFCKGSDDEEDPISDPSVICLNVDLFFAHFISIESITNVTGCRVL